MNFRFLKFPAGVVLLATRLMIRVPDRVAFMAVVPPYLSAGIEG